MVIRQVVAGSEFEEADNRVVSGLRWYVCVIVLGWHLEILSGVIEVLLMRGVKSFERDQRHASCRMREGR